LSGSEIVARFPPEQKTSNGDSKEVLLQRQGNEDKGEGHLGNDSWYDDDEEADPPIKRHNKTKIAVDGILLKSFGLY